MSVHSVNRKQHHLQPQINKVYTVRKLLKRILAAYVLAHKDIPPGAMY